MKQGIKITISPNVEKNTWHIMQLFMSDWLSSCCKHNYTFVEEHHQYAIVFDSREDAIISRLKGIPPTLHKYISFADDK